MERDAKTNIVSCDLSYIAGEFSITKIFSIREDINICCRMFIDTAVKKIYKIIT